MRRHAAAILAWTCLTAGGSFAQPYPAKPVRIMIGFGPGGGADVVARIVAQKMTESMGQQVLVENRPGAAGTVATSAVAKSPPDGYTLQIISAAEPNQGALRKLSYDLARDFAPVSLIALGGFVLVVHASVPVNDVKALIALTRAQPGKLTYGSSGVGGTPHLAGELFALMAKVRILHVPYKGGADAMVANASGEVDMSFNSIPSVMPLLATRRVRALGITGARRSASLPSVPTVAEAGLPGYDISGWFGMLAPAGVPKEIIAQLNAAITRAVRLPDVNEVFARQGLEAQGTTSEQFGEFIRKEIVKSAMLIKTIGLKPE